MSILAVEFCAMCWVEAVQAAVWLLGGSFNGAVWSPPENFPLFLQREVFAGLQHAAFS